jgi:hypothetical protein
MTKMNLTQEQVNEIVAEAMTEANRAARAELALRGDRDCCGFAWVNIWNFNGDKIKGNTKMGKMLKAAGLRQNYLKAFEIWNPAKLPVQSLNILEEGAEAAAKVFRRYGFDAYSGSRMD